VLARRVLVDALENLVTQSLGLIAVLIQLRAEVVIVADAADL